MAEAPPRAAAGDAGLFTQRVLALAAEGTPRVELFRRLAALLHAACRGSRLELWVAEDQRWLRSTVDADGGFGLEVLDRAHAGPAAVTEVCAGAGLEPVGWEHGVLWAHARGDRSATSSSGAAPRTLVPLWAGEDPTGWLVLASSGPEYVIRRETAWFGRVAGTLGTALEVHRVHAALRERVKELSALSRIGQLAATPGLSQRQLLAEVVELLPGAWQYPDIATATIELDGDTVRAGADGVEVASQEVDLVVGGTVRGSISVSYVEDRPTIGNGPFLPEEDRLIEVIAQQLTVILERREAAVERTRLQEQLLHADRLATLGMLAAGVGHELNEPLGAILGFAQLARKADGLPDDAARDLGKIEAAALHAREIVRKLVGFARKSPATRGPVDVNAVVAEGLDLLASRCRARGVAVEIAPGRGLPAVEADRAQLQQVLVNLVVNALDAMPDGGRLTVSTSAGGGTVRIAVRDTGGGITDEVRRKMFLPFFTTRGAADGTGLGLALVHDIVSEAGGTIRVDSGPGDGTEIVVDLPAAAAVPSGTPA